VLASHKSAITDKLSAIIIFNILAFKFSMI